MTATLFLAFLAVTAAVLVALVGLYMNRRAAIGVLAGLAAWFIYAGLLGYTGVLKNTAMRPPGLAFLVVPVLLFLVLFTVRVARFYPSRCGGCVPALDTPGGTMLPKRRRVVSAPTLDRRRRAQNADLRGAQRGHLRRGVGSLVAWLATRRRRGRGLALAWNLLGLLALANVVTRSVLTTPGPFNRIHAEIPNRMMSTFPFLFIPAFFVPLAVVLHVLAIRKLVGRGASSIERSSS